MQQVYLLYLHDMVLSRICHLSWLSVCRLSWTRPQSSLTMKWTVKRTLPSRFDQQWLEHRPSCRHKDEVGFWSHPECQQCSQQHSKKWQLRDIHVHSFFNKKPNQGDWFWWKVGAIFGTMQYILLGKLQRNPQNWVYENDLTFAVVVSLVEYLTMLDLWATCTLQMLDSWKAIFGASRRISSDSQT